MFVASSFLSGAMRLVCVCASLRLVHETTRSRGIGVQPKNMRRVGRREYSHFDTGLRELIILRIAWLETTWGGFVYVEIRKATRETSVLSADRYFVCCYAA